MPDRYPSAATCHRRFQQWVRTGVFAKILHALALDLRDRGKLDLTECFIDATFVGAKKGGFVLDPRGVGRARDPWPWQTAVVFLSPLTWPVLRQLKSRSSRPPSTRASSSGASSRAESPMSSTSSASSGLAASSSCCAGVYEQLLASRRRPPGLAGEAAGV